MAREKRMFSSDIVGSDSFLEMPPTTQNLYFHLGMKADDDGFVNPRMVMRILGSTNDDINILIMKRFVLPFDTGVVVIKHWLIHNNIRADMYNETTYQREKKTLGLNDFGAYTELENAVEELKKISTPKWLERRRTANVPQTALRLDKIRLDKNSNTVLSDQSDDTPDQPDEHDPNYNDERFNFFWKEYPRKVGKGKAFESWKKLKLSDKKAREIIISVRKHTQSNDWKKENGKYIPNPATFLNQRRFDDEIALSENNPSSIEQY